MALKSFDFFRIAWGMSMDAVIWLLPHCVVWKLQLRRAHKIAITLIFALGLLNLLVAIFRIISITKLDVPHDMTYNLSEAFVWMYVQLSTAIILACCPLLRPVFEKLIPRGLTRIHTWQSSSSRFSFKLASTTYSRGKIKKTTRIHLNPESAEQAHEPAVPMGLGWGLRAGPTFKIEQSEPSPNRRVSRIC